MERTCDYCGKTYSRPPSLIGHFCSKTCGYAAMRKAQTGRRRVRRHPDHPLAGKTGLVAEARALLYDTIGPGPHTCHWCGRKVNWLTGRSGNVPEALIADHVDNNPLNDALDNIVPACGVCNGTRTQHVRDDEVYVLKRGYRFRALERTCETCAKPFRSIKSEVAIGKGRFCSRSCARKAPRR